MSAMLNRPLSLSLRRVLVCLQVWALASSSSSSSGAAGSDGHLLVSGSSDGRAVVWRDSTEEEREEEAQRMVRKGGRGGGGKERVGGTAEQREGGKEGWKDRGREGRRGERRFRHSSFHRSILYFLSLVIPLSFSIYIFSQKSLAFHLSLIPIAFRSLPPSPTCLLSHSLRSPRSCSLSCLSLLPSLCHCSLSLFLTLFSLPSFHLPFISFPSLSPSPPKVRSRRLKRSRP